MLKIALSGGSGYIGSNLIKKINLKKVKLILIENKRKINLKSFLKININIKKNKINLFKKIGSPNIFVHLAWPNLNNHNSKKHFQTCNAHFNFLKNLIDNGLKNLIVSGTCFEYGNKKNILKESQKITNPITNYAKAKNRLRIRLENLKKKKKFNFTWLRLFFIYGETYKSKKQTNLWSQIIKNEIKNKKNFNMTSGKQIRDYLHIEKVSDYICKIILKNKSFGIVNICSGKKNNLKENVLKWKKKYKLKSHFIFNKQKLKKYEPHMIVGSNLKLKKILS